MSYGGDDNTDPDNQDFEHQELIDMVHEKRGVTPGAEPEQMVPRRPTRITHHEIKAMKVTVQKETSATVGLFRKVAGLFSGLAVMFGSLFSSRRIKLTQCEMNGHTFPKHWKGDFPRCTHCRTVIKSPDQVKPGGQ